MSTYTPDASSGPNLDPTTRRSLSAFATRRRFLLFLRAVAAGIVVFVAVMLLIALCDYVWLLSDAMRWTLSMIGYGVTLAAVWYFGFRDFGNQDSRLLARQMESTAPRLREDLLSAVELSDPQDANGSPVFRERLQGRVARRISQVKVSELLPLSLVRRWTLFGSAVIAVCIVLLMIPSMQFGRRFARAMLVGVPVERASRTQINIIEPAPPTRFVAEGDAVAVIVEIGGEPADEVMMYWRNAEGAQGETLMTPRVRPAVNIGEQDDAASSVGDHFAANLSVGTVPVEYKIHAGDAITFWHELTPLPRPRVQLFEKRYVFPDYARLNDRVEQDEHGDLRAIVGTMAEVTAEFDEPVSEATIRYGNRGAEVEMEPVDGSATKFQVSIPIKTPGQYQVDATSVRSGLSNPFSPTYTINPVVDSPPTVRWTGMNSDDLRLVSPLAVLDLAGEIQDDLPVDHIIQEIRVNGGDMETMPIAIDSPAREIRPSWEWDLMHRNGTVTATEKLKSGDIVQTRLTAIDRRGQRGESRTIDLLIADDGFKEDRHDHIAAFSKLTEDVIAWRAQANNLATSLKKVAGDRGIFDVDDALDQKKLLDDATNAVVEKLAEELEGTDDLMVANSLELVARSIVSVNSELQYVIDDLDEVLPSNASEAKSKVWEAGRKRYSRELAHLALRSEHQAGRVETVMRCMLGHEVSLGVSRDARSLRNSLQPMIRSNGAVPVGRFLRYLNVVIGRMRAVDNLVDKHAQNMPESTVSHFRGEHWKRWAERWRIQLERTVERPPRDESFRALVRSFDDQLGKKIGAEMSDNRLAQVYVDHHRDLRREMRPLAEYLTDIARKGSESEKYASRARSEDKPDEVAELKKSANYLSGSYRRTLRLLQERLVSETSIHRRRPRVDLQYMSDLGLLKRAVGNVNQDGFEPYRDEPAQAVHNNLSKAIRVLESVHEASLSQKELEGLEREERGVSDSPEADLSHPLVIERFQKSFEWPVRGLQSAGIDWNKFLNRLDQVRHNSDFNAARERLTRRRYENKQPVSAELPVGRLTRELRESLLELEPEVEAAREMIKRYVLTLSEQAREAAEEARQAKERTEQRPDNEEETADRLDEEQEAAEQAAEETIQSLVDAANTSDITDQEQRELSRDADAAAAMIQDAVQRADKAMEEAKKSQSDDAREQALENAETALEQLEDSLKQTAEHFERAERGEDLAESREQLRQAESELDIAEDLQERYDEAEEMAEAANSSPEELLKELERELGRNEQMQEELSDISENAARAAQQALEQAETEERQLNQSLERSDAALQEEKRRTAKKMEELSRRANSVQNHILETSRQAANWAKDAETKESIEKAKEQVQKAARAVAEMGGENALADEMKAAAEQMSEALQQAEKAIEDAKQKANEASKQQTHANDRERESVKRSMESQARNLRNRMIQDLNRESSQWKREESEAARRIQNAQRQRRQAEDSRKRAEQQLAKAKEPNQWQEQQVEQLKQREENARRAEKAADESRDFAKDQRKGVDVQNKQIRSQNTPKLDRPNPAAQLAEQTAQQAGEALKQIQKELAEVAKDLPNTQQLQTQENQSQNLANQQQGIKSDVENAAEQVARSSRHEQRLGNQNSAQELEKAAQAIEQNSMQSTNEAEQALQAAAESSKQASEAGKKLSQATEKLDQDAKSLGEMLEQLAQISAAESNQNEQSASSPADNASQSEETQSKARQLAQTLDELDQAIAEAAKQQAQQQQNPSGQQPGQQPGEQGEQANQQSGQQPGQQQPGEQSGQPQPGQPTSGESSPTLAEMLDSQQQQAARQRQQMQQQSEPGQPSPSQQSGQEQPGQQTGEMSGERSEMPAEDDAALPNFVAGELGQWGQLRQRRTDDAAENRKTRIAPQYRREVEAYFRAIAERAAEKRN